MKNYRYIKYIDEHEDLVLADDIICQDIRSFKRIERIDDIKHRRLHLVKITAETGRSNRKLLIIHPDYDDCFTQSINQKRLEYFKYFYPDSDIIWIDPPGMGGSTLSEKAVFLSEYVNVLASALQEIVDIANYNYVEAVGWLFGAITIASLIAELDPYSITRAVLWDPPMVRANALRTLYNLMISERDERKNEYLMSASFCSETISLSAQKGTFFFKKHFVSKLEAMSLGMEYWSSIPMALVTELVVVAPELSSLNDISKLRLLMHQRVLPDSSRIVFRELLDTSSVFPAIDTELFIRSFLKNPNQ